MSEPTLSTPAGPRSTLRARPPPLRTTSPSPARPQRSSDDLLSHLTPATAVEALQSPSGPLKACLEQASVSEQAFALKIAIASKTIHSWLDELSDWPWPSTSTSTGFEMPPLKRRESFEHKTPGDARGYTHEADPSSDVTYYGSLLADDVIRYEKRIEQIHQDMDGLDLEDIKNQVLHNHILPLSRPGTPFSDAGRSVASVFSFAKMEDLTAIVTAITVQTLPVLSKLSRLLHTWDVRLVILRKVPSLLMMITDAEVALRSGWSAIEPPSRNNFDSTKDNMEVKTWTPHLSQKDFEVMKTVLQQKVARPGRELDFMLDTLEGMADTLPEEWLDRMEFIERDYADWVTTAERKVREGECSNVSSAGMNNVVLPQTPGPNIHIQDESPSKLPTSPGFSNYEPLEEEDRESWAIRILGDQSSKDAAKSASQANDSPKHVAQNRVIEFGDWLEELKPAHDENSNRMVSPKSNDKIVSTVLSSTSQGSPTKEQHNPTYDGSEDAGVEYHSSRQKPILSEVNRNIVRQPANQLLKHGAVSKPLFEDDFEPSFLESVNEEEEEEPELPPTYLEARKSSDPSVGSVVYHGSSAYSPDYSDRGAFREASMDPELPHLADPDQPFSSDAISPPSSPPLRYKPRSASVTFKDLPEIAPLPEVDDSPPRTPLEPPEVFDPDASFEWDSQLGSPSRMSIISTINDDDHLQKQLRELLETIPAKIELKKRGINLNPPDLQLPSRPKPRSDPSRRPTSALSSRTESRMGTPSYSRSVTPSFMLAPVRDTRPRSTSSQGIRLYHLSRSGEMPIKLFIRCVGEQNERVMVRVGGGWSDLGEYLRDYAIHHGSRSKGEGKVEITDAVPAANKRVGSSPGSRPGSALDSPMTPLTVRKTRKNPGEEVIPRAPRTPLAKTSALNENANTPASEASVRSRASSHIDWDEEDSSLGLAGPKAAKRREISDESRAWIESVKHKVRLASGERLAASASSEHLRSSQNQGHQKKTLDDRFGEIGKVGSTKRLFRKN